MTPENTDAPRKEGGVPTPLMGDASGDAGTPAPLSSGKDAQREWAMDYMARNSFGSFPNSFDTGTTYDQGADFCEAFSEAFPGRKADPNLTLASRRLARLLRGMWEDGLVTRGRLGNNKYLPQEPSWQYVYSLYPRDFARRKAAILAAAQVTPPSTQGGQGPTDHAQAEIAQVREEP